MDMNCQECIKIIMNKNEVSTYGEICYGCGKSIRYFDTTRNFLKQHFCYLNNHLYLHYLNYTETRLIYDDLLEDKPNCEDYLLYQLDPEMYITKRQRQLLKRIFWLTIAKLISMKPHAMTSVDQIVGNSDLQRFIGEYL